MSLKNVGFFFMVLALASPPIVAIDKNKYGDNFTDDIYDNSYLKTAINLARKNPKARPTVIIIFLYLTLIKKLKTIVKESVVGDQNRSFQNNYILP